MSELPQKKKSTLKEIMAKTKAREIKDHEFDRTFRLLEQGFAHYFSTREVTLQSAIDSGTIAENIESSSPPEPMMEE